MTKRLLVKVSNECFPKEYCVNRTDRPKSVRNRCVFEVFGGGFMLSRCFWDFSVGVGAFVIGLSQISTFSLRVFVNCATMSALCMKFVVKLRGIVMF